MSSKRGLGRIISALLATSCIFGGAGAETNHLLPDVARFFTGVCVYMNIRKGLGLGRVVSALLAASSMIGGVSAETNHKDVSDNEYYGEVFSEENFEAYYSGVLDGIDNIKLESLNLSSIRELEYDFEGKKIDVEFVSVLDDVNNEESSLLRAIVMNAFLWNCFCSICEMFDEFYPKTLLVVLQKSERIFHSFDEIKEFFFKFCDDSVLLESIDEEIQFYSSFAGEYKDKLVIELQNYGDKVNKKLVFEEGKIKCVARRES